MVAVVRGVVVAVRHAAVPGIVVPAATTQHAVGALQPSPLFYPHILSNIFAHSFSQLVAVCMFCKSKQWDRMIGIDCLCPLTRIQV